MKHTPGPWKYHKCDSTGEQNSPQRMYVIAVGDHKGVVVDEVLSCCADNQEANARLIAAAPDLLEACKFGLNLLCQCCKSLNPHHHNCTSCKDIDIIKQAISRAEGKEGER